MVCNLRRFGQAALLVFVCLPCDAFPMQAEASEILAPEAEPASDESELEVDLAFIEFLGQWETDDGEWIAPSDLADEAFVELIETMGSVEIEEID
tara:strand:+ start:450 stop:734 length:285 start_codon:yes stop_codon:yes gene_type:complete